MNLPNTHFTDFPIEFKEINPEDFPHFEVGEKIIINPNEEGYITENLIANINLEEKNTELKKFETLYSIMLDDFFDSEPTRLTRGIRANVRKIIAIKNIPTYTETSNFIYSPNYKFPENFEDNLNILN